MPYSESTPRMAVEVESTHEEHHHSDFHVLNEQANKARFPKIWNIRDPFEFAPPKPKEDTWSLLLEPLLKTDKARCNAWRDEVQNLLIFAGLFSAVVTAFIIESYQNLQPDPNDTVIFLLSRIAARLESLPTSNSSLPLPTTAPQFVPDPSALRINTLWFISLVLSLTTVLVGIISLQWLREHELDSILDLAPREVYALHHMRYQSLIVWHVDKIFAALPLLLQCSLVLFLIGVIDFLHAIIAGNWTVTAPVSIVAGLTFIFLIATALLPSLQFLSLYFHSPPEQGHLGGSNLTPPCPCPYKSPQSHAVRTLSSPLVQLFHRFHPRIRQLTHKVRRILQNPFSHSPELSPPSDLFERYLFYASLDLKWIDYDISWLAIRDGFMRCAFGQELWFETAGLGCDEILPLYDIVRGLDTQNYQRHSATAAYHCFAEISELTLLPLHSHNSTYNSLRDRCCQSGYLHDLLAPTCGSTFLPDMFQFDCMSVSQGFNGMTMEALHDILHQDNTYLFLKNHIFGDVPLLSTHRKELSLRLSAYFYQENYAVRSSDQNLKFPESLTFTPFEVILEPDLKRDEFNAIAWQVANVTLSIMKQCIGDIHPNTLLRHAIAQKAGGGIHSFIQGACYFTSWLALKANRRDYSDKSPSRVLERGIMESFHALFSFIDTQLNDEISSWSTAQGRPSLFFYIASLYAHDIMKFLENDPIFVSLRKTIWKYKRRTIDMGIVDSGIGLHIDSIPFSATWWNDFKVSDTSDAALGGRSSPSIVIFYPVETSDHHY